MAYSERRSTCAFRGQAISGSTWACDFWPSGVIFYDLGLDGLLPGSAVGAFLIHSEFILTTPTGAFRRALEQDICRQIDMTWDIVE